MPRLAPAAHAAHAAARALLRAVSRQGAAGAGGPTSGERAILIVAIVIPALGVLACAHFFLYGYCCRGRRRLPAPAPVATAGAPLSPRRRETFVGGDPAKMDSFIVHARDAGARCPLCAARLDARAVTAGRCGHLSHTDCLRAWVGAGARAAAAACPVCQRGMALGKSSFRAAGAPAGGRGGGGGGGDFDDVADQVSSDSGGEEAGRPPARRPPAPGPAPEADAPPPVQDALALAYVRRNSSAGRAPAAGAGGGEDEEAPGCARVER